MKISGHVAPIATPRDIIAILNKFPCHHFKVNDLNMFIGLLYHKSQSQYRRPIFFRRWRIQMKYGILGIKSKIVLQPALLSARNPTFLI